MTATQGPGWHPDPYGRFAQRYHDGTRWTEHVVDQGRNPHVDPPGPAQPTGTPPVMAPAAPFQARQAGVPPPAYDWSSTPAHARQPDGQEPGFAFTVGMMVASAGAALVLLSVFVLDFVNAPIFGTMTLDDVRDLLDWIEDSVGDEATSGTVVSAYATSGRYLALLAIGFAVFAAGFQRGKAVAIIAASVAGFFLLWHLLALLDAIGDNIEPESGAFVGIVGWIAVGVGALLRKPIGGAKSGSPPVSPPYNAPGGPPGPHQRGQF